MGKPEKLLDKLPCSVVSGLIQVSKKCQREERYQQQPKKKNKRTNNSLVSQGKLPKQNTEGRRSKNQTSEEKGKDIPGRENNISRAKASVDSSEVKGILTWV